MPIKLLLQFNVALVLFVSLAARPAQQGDSGTAAAVASPGDLAAALNQSSISNIIITGEYVVGKELVQPGGPVKLSRNLTITGQDGINSVLDLDFQQAQLQLCDTCRLTFTNITVANERRGNGSPFDLIIGSGDAAIELHNVVRLRLACTTAAAFGAVIDKTPRSRLYPHNATAGTGQHWQVHNFLYKGKVYDDQLNPIDYSVDNPVTLQEGKGLYGGYALWAQNVTRLCYHTISADCLAEKTAEACVNILIDDLLSAKAGRRPAALTVAVAVSLGVAVLLAVVLAVFLIKRRKRMQQQREQKAQQMQKLQGFGSVMPMQDFVAKDVHNGNQPETPGAARTAYRHTPRRQDSSCSFRGCMQPMAASKGWRLTSSNTTPLLGDVADVNIEFGELLGSGSFGRVFHGRWAGREVAIKVIEHNTSSSQAVEHEAQLLLSLNHPNVVRCFHYVTYEQDRSSRDLTRQDSKNSSMLTGDRSSRDIFRRDSISTGDKEAERQQMCRQGSSALNSIQDTSKQSLSQWVQGTPDNKCVTVNTTGSSAGTDNLGQCQPQPEQIVAAGQSCSSPLASGVLMLPDMPPQQQQQQPPSGSAESCGLHKPLLTAGSSDLLVLGGATGTRGPGTIRDMRRAETWLVVEYCDMGTLQEVAQHYWDPATEGNEQMRARLLLLLDAARGLEALHARQVVHADLNARNVLVSSSPMARHIQMTAKVSDLGLARVLQQHETHRTTQTVGTMSHMAPELLQQGRMSAAADVYSFGIMMWEVYTGRMAFEKLHYGQFFEAIVMHKLRPMMVPGMPAGYQLLMESCWQSEPGDRPSSVRLVQCLEMLLQQYSNTPTPAKPSLATTSAPLQAATKSAPDVDDNTLPQRVATVRRGKAAAADGLPFAVADSNISSFNLECDDEDVGGSAQSVGAAASGTRKLSVMQDSVRVSGEVDAHNWVV